MPGTGNSQGKVGSKRGVSRKAREVRLENKGAGMADEVIPSRAGWGGETGSILSAMQSQGRILAERKDATWLGIEQSSPWLLGEEWRVGSESGNGDQVGAIIQVRGEKLARARRWQGRWREVI